MMSSEASSEIAESHPKFSIDNDLCGGWPVWKKRAEESGLTKALSDTALMLLWMSLGHNCWRIQLEVRR
jgi:hypothetical protein